MPTKTRSAARNSRTKADLEEELETLKNRLDSQEAPDPVGAKLASDHASKTLQIAKGLSVDSIVANGAKFGLDVSRTVAGLTEQAMQKAEELKTLQDAIVIETAALENLYALDVVSASIQGLVQEHETRKSNFTTEMTLLKTAWQEESKLHERWVDQRNKDLQQARAREQADYDYKTKLERSQATDEFNFAMAKRERERIENEAQIQKSINDRLGVIAAQEKEISDMRAKIASFDTEVSKASTTAAEMAKNAMKRDLTATFVLEKKDLETQIALTNQQNTQAQSTIVSMREEISKLQVQVSEARQEVKDIAKSAVEGASGQLALSKVMESQKENGQNPPRRS